MYIPTVVQGASSFLTWSMTFSWQALNGNSHHSFCIHHCSSKLDCRKCNIYYYLTSAISTRSFFLNKNSLHGDEASAAVNEPYSILPLRPITNYRACLFFHHTHTHTHTHTHLNTHTHT